MKLRSRTIRGRSHGRRRFRKFHRFELNFKRSMQTRSMAIAANEPGPVTTIEHLPTELLLAIFSHLSPPDLLTASQVCPRWQNIAGDFTLWKHVSVNDSDLTTEELVRIIRCQRRIEGIALWRRDDADAVLFEIARYSSNLRSLTVFGCHGSKQRRNIRAKPLLSVLKSCRALRELSIEGSSFRSCVFYRYLLGNLQGKLRRVRLHVQPTQREWDCLYAAQERRQLVIGEPQAAL